MDEQSLGGSGPDAPAQAQVESSVWAGQLGRLCNSFTRFDELYGLFAKRYGETYFSLWILEEIGDRPEGLTQKQIGALLHLPKQTVSSIVAGLVKRGLVSTRPSPTDGRSKVHTLSPQGRELYERERADIFAIEDAVLSGIGEPRLVAMNEAFEELNELFASALEGVSDLDGSPQK
ncbi:MAG: MarR family transcriptional regulator [Coriobacteriia bacterium]|nr:MarR family transcriptional regulator [Coriobacteriia bacterium]